MFVIFALTEGCDFGRSSSSSAPVFIGVTATSIVCLLAPLKRAGLSPARDLGPRLVAWLAGWGSTALPDKVGGFLWAYVLSPVTGVVAAAFFFTPVVEPAMRLSSDPCGCRADDLTRHTHATMLPSSEGDPS